jgi:serine/threonine protein kinase
LRTAATPIRATIAESLGGIDEQGNKRMTPERWQQIRGLLEDALELAPEQRSAFLQRKCSSDPSLRQEVETLLASSPDVRSSFLQSTSLRLTLTSGTKLGEYEVKSLLGSGGMGEVYRAHDSRLGRDVAIKVLPLLSADSDRLHRFEQEARAAAALNHPNILAVFQMGSYQGAPYLVSELLEGETLREQLKRGRLSLRKTIDYGVQIARGLATAHEKGIVHRDVKPENLFVTRNGTVKILDFGLAKLAQPESNPDRTEGTEPGAVMGTVGYMAPEQVRGQTTDQRADIFAFGAILYEMLAGKRAFQKPTSADTLSAILNEDPPGISQVTTNIPSALQRVVHRCLEKNPGQRFQSAFDLAFALDALSDASGSASKFPRKDGGGSASPTSVREHKLAPAAGLVLVAFLIGALLYSTHRLRLTSVSHGQITHKQFTFSGDAYDPAISPDGLFVSYVSKKPGEKQKLMVQSSNGAALELARGAVINTPRWSPDGSELLFFWFEPAAKTRGIFVVSRLGGVARLISDGAYACWLAPDGSQLITAAPGTTGPRRGISLVNKLTGEATEIHLSAYTWLYDLDCSAHAGLILAVTQESGKYQIRTFKPDGGKERKLVEESDQIYAARWSSSSDAIYYLRGKGSTKQLSKVSVTRVPAVPEVLADGLQCGGFFTLSADESRLAYTREDHSSNLWRVELPAAGKSGKPEISRVTSGTSYHGEPAFSPDGRSIVFALGPNPDETNIFKMPVPGDEPLQLTFFEHALTASPAWSPDGAHVAFIGDQDGTRRVWTISAKGGPPQILKGTNASDTSNKLTWWPNNDIVYQQSGLKNLLEINRKTQAERTVIPQDRQSSGWIVTKPIFSPDKKSIAAFLNRSEAEVGFWTISVEPYSETLIRSGPIFPFGWSPDGKYVYAIRAEAGEFGRELVQVQVALPRKVTSLATLPGDVTEVDSASVSPDGKEIIASVSEQKSDVWLMENFYQSSR